MRSLIAWWADNHVAANLMMIAIIVAGILGFNKLEREIFPTIAFPGMQVVVVWPGASPRDVEEQIVSRIEESLKDLENLDWIRSESGEGYGGVYIMAENASDFASVMDDVTSRVRGISSLPPDIEQPRITQWVTREEMMRIAVHGNVGERELKRLAEDMRREVAQLKGVSVVETFGTRNEEISIEVSESALRRYRISFDEITRAIRGSSINLSAGNVRTGGGEYTLRTDNLADTEIDFSSIVVRQLSSGGVITVGDVATVIDGFEENEILATLNGEPAVLVQVMSSEVMDVVQMSESVNEWMEKRRASLPPGVSLTLWQDSAVDFNSRMSTIGAAAFSGLILVFIVLFLTLRPIVAFWVSVGVGTAYAGAFVLMPMLGVSLNMLSTFAFLLVLGIVVDDAIIIGERIHTEVESGNGGLKGAVDGAFRVSKPVIFGVLTTIIAFLPWLFISGATSEFTRQISWVVILALVFSLIESLFILPAHLANIKPVHTHNVFTRAQNRIAESIVWFGDVKFGKLLRKVLRFPGLTLVSFVALFIVVVIGLMGGGYVKSSFNPEIDAEQVDVNIDLREGTTYDRALEILDQIQHAQSQLIKEVEEGAEDGDNNQVIENWYTRSRRDSVIAIMRLAPAEVRALTAKEVALRLRDLIGPVPEAKSVSVGYSMDSNGPDLDISVRHPDLDQLQLAVDEITDKLRGFSSLYDVSNNLDSASEELRFQLKPGAEQLGVTLAQVMQQIRQAYYGDEVQRLPRASQDVRVMVRYPQASRNSLESLKHFRVRTNDGREVPLTSLVDISYGPGLKEIQHWDGLRSARVQGYLREPVMKEIMKEMNEQFFPKLEDKYPGLTRAAIGQQVAEAEFNAEIGRLGLIALFAVLFLLAIAFKSYFQPVVIIVALPFAFVGAVLGHFLLNESFSLFSIFGVVAAFGVVINDNLVLVDSFNEYRLKGLNVTEAIVKAGKSRFRAILITSVTTFVGLIPLMLEQSSQAAFLKPVVISLAFALLVAFFVTLFLVPALLVLGDRFWGFMGRGANSVKLKANYVKAKFEA
ncbi:efflux RND transporter permease subunit [Arenicella xantha]|uniref:Multidrug efflux pump subunit AcrB n=1 Tax=Arenicella xantha TaxID=644221 RepID=A0A395JLX4_9GAMM|nr:efflux RND transporter permease subunit [Arenicella xantha]RBP51599.1 multidrug efflux pump subunit AcrB [Arenicella xantha]